VNVRLQKSHLHTVYIFLCNGQHFVIGGSYGLVINLSDILRVILFILQGWQMENHCIIP